MCNVKSGVALEHSLFPFFCLSDYILLWQALSLPRTVEQNDNERGKVEREMDRDRERTKERGA